MRLILFVITTVICLNTILLAERKLKFGVFAYRDKSVVEEQYKQLTNYLNRSMSDTKIELVVLEREELETELERNTLDIVSTNPSHFEIIRSKIPSIKVIATTQKMQNSIRMDNFGGVIFSLKSNKSIKNLSDLRGKTVASMSYKSLGAHQAQAYELLKSGIVLQKDTNLVVMKKHDLIVQAVLDGRVDVGFIRTGIIEALVNEKKLNLNQINIINPQNMYYFPYVVSTRLYPEWPMAVLPHIELGLVRELTLMLLSYNGIEDHFDSVSGFSLPNNYYPVKNLVSSLNLPPYDKIQSVTFQQIYEQYRTEIIAIIVIFFIIVISIIYIVHLNLRLQTSEERFALAIEGSEDGLFDWNMVDNTMVHSKRFETMLGYSGDELPKTVEAWENLLHPDDRKKAYDVVEEYLKTKGKGTYVNIFRMQAKDGTWRWIEGRGKAIFNHKGKPVRFIGFNSDITDKKYT